MLSKPFPILSITAIIILLFLNTSLPASIEQQTEDEAAAVVNDVVIGKKALDQNVTIVLRKKGLLKNDLPQDQLFEITHQTLEELIDRELLFQESRKLGLLVEEKIVDQQYELMKKMYPDQSTFAEKLSAVNLSETEMKLQVERGLLIRRLIQEKVVGRAQTTEDESLAFYEKNKSQFKQPEMVRAQHILVSFPPNMPADRKQEAREKLEKIKKRIKRGESFSALAKKFSDDPNGKNGGELGYFDRNKMVEPFSKAAFSLAVNDVSDVVETEYGFHLIKVLDKQPERIPAFGEIKEDITQLIVQKKIANGIKSYIKILRDKAKIKKFLQG
ncbi:MAG: peptidylprolyl isomerase [Pseudomonadota bacterium]